MWAELPGTMLMMCTELYRAAITQSRRDCWLLPSPLHRQCARPAFEMRASANPEGRFPEIADAIRAHSPGAGIILEKESDAKLVLRHATHKR